MDDELAVRFQALTTDVHQHLRLAPSARIRAVGDRRRVKALAGVAGVAAGFTALVGGGTAAVLAPPPPATSPTWVRLPAGFTLPHENDPGWRRQDSLSGTAVIRGCLGVSDPTLAGRTDARTVLAPDGKIVEQVFVFRDETTSAAAMMALTRDCDVTTLGNGPMAGFGSSWGDGISETADQIGFVGNVMFVVSVRGMAGSGVDERGRALMMDIAGRLCRAMALCGGPLLDDAIGIGIGIAFAFGGCEWRASAMIGVCASSST